MLKYNSWMCAVGVIAIKSGGFNFGGNRFLAMEWGEIWRHPNRRAKTHTPKIR